MTGRLAQTRCFLLDMDGTFYLGNQLLPGALEFIDLIKRLDIPFFFLTNNSSRNRRDYAEKIRNLGLSDLLDRQVLTSGEATAIYLKKHIPDARLFVAGTPSLQNEFLTQGFSLTSKDPDAVVLGFDTTLTYEKLRLICDLVRSGKPFYATHPDINCPTEHGFMPDIGSILAFIEASTGKKPELIIGKPYSTIIEVLIEKTGLPVGSIAMIGDRLYTDIALGKAGLITILVLCGETHYEDLALSPFQPDLTVGNLAEFIPILNNVFFDSIGSDGFAHNT